jgi:hypothetical protein
VKLCPFMVFSAAITVFGCYGTKPPASLLDLDEMIRANGDSLPEGWVPGAWAEGVKYLDLAQKAIDERHSPQADRFAKLGIVHIKTAMAAMSQVDFGKRLEAGLKKREEVVSNTEGFIAKIERLEAQMERRRIRRHLEEVVHETRRKAAAFEELQEKNLRGKVKRERNSARLQVAKEMLAIGEIWKDLLDVFVAARALDEKRTVTVVEELQQAKDALPGLDLAKMQQHLEKAGALTRRLLGEAMEEGGGPSAALAQLSVEVKAQGFEVVDETFGVAVTVALPLKDNASRLTKLGEVFDKFSGLHGIVLASYGTLEHPQKASARSNARAKSIAEVLLRSGVSQERLHVRGCGATSPLKTLVKGRERATVLLVPIK